jgi:hypothetical protein
MTASVVRRPAADAPPLPVPEAIAAVLVASAAVDGTLNAHKAVRMNELLSSAPVFRRPDGDPIPGLAARAIELLTDQGLPAVLTACARSIPETLRPTTFALAVELVLSDGRIGDRERSFIDELQGVLRIGDSTALKIMDVLLLKHRG